MHLIFNSGALELGVKKTNCNFPSFFPSCLLIKQHISMCFPLTTGVYFCNKCQKDLQCGHWRHSLLRHVASNRAPLSAPAVPGCNWGACCDKLLPPSMPWTRSLGQRGTLTTLYLFTSHCPFQYGSEFSRSCCVSWYDPYVCMHACTH